MPNYKPESPPKERLLWPVLIAFGVIASFANSLEVPFLLDDYPNIVDNASLRALGTALWPSPEALTGGRPLLNLSLALNHGLGGADPRGFHVTNLIVHVLAALTLFGVIRRSLLLEGWRGSGAQAAGRVGFAAALLWAVHPVQTNSVTYLSQRAESLMGLCYLLTLYAFIRAAAERRTGWAWTAVAACWVGMLVKEVMVTAPVMVLLFDRLFLAGSFREAWRRRGRLHSGLFASWLALAVLMAASRIQTRGIGYGFEYSWSQYLRIETWAVLHYLGLAIWPFPLIFDYGPDLPPTPAGVAALSGVVLALLAAGIAAAWRRRPQLAFLGCWFFLILAPTSSLVPVAGQPVAENRLYLPLAAWTVFLTTTVHAMAGKRGQASLVAGAFALSALTVTRNRTCGRPLSLWGETVAKNPGNSRAHFYHADALARAGQNEAAAAHLARSLQLRPAPKTHFKLGVLQFQQGRFREAADNFGAALRALPGDAASHQNYASALVRLGREAEAVEHFRQAKQLLPESVECRVNLAITLGRLGRLPEAIREFEEVLQRDPANRQALGELAQLRALARPAR